MFNKKGKWFLQPMIYLNIDLFWRLLGNNYIFSFFFLSKIKSKDVLNMMVEKISIILFLSL